MTNRLFFAWTGASLVLAGLLMIGLNAALTPLLPQGTFAELAASSVFVLRQSLASLTVVLMLYGVIGLYIRQLHRVSLFGAIAFAVAVAGAMGLFAVEWNQLFTIRDFAQQAPETLIAVEDAPGLTPFDIGSLIAASTFFGGWFLFAISILLARVHSRIGSVLVLAGFFIAPILSAAGIANAWAVIGSSAVIGAGWVLLGLQMARQSGQPVPAKTASPAPA